MGAAIPLKCQPVIDQRKIARSFQYETTLDQLLTAAARDCEFFHKRQLTFPGLFCLMIAGHEIEFRAN